MPSVVISSKTFLLYFSLNKKITILFNVIQLKMTVTPTNFINLPLYQIRAFTQLLLISKIFSCQSENLPFVVVFFLIKLNFLSSLIFF